MLGVLEELSMILTNPPAQDAPNTRRQLKLHPARSDRLNKGVDRIVQTATQPRIGQEVQRFLLALSRSQEIEKLKETEGE